MVRESAFYVVVVCVCVCVCVCMRVHMCMYLIVHACTLIEYSVRVSVAPRLFGGRAWVRG